MLSQGPGATAELLVVMWGPWSSDTLIRTPRQKGFLPEEVSRGPGGNNVSIKEERDFSRPGGNNNLKIHTFMVMGTKESQLVPRRMLGQEL